MPGVSCRGGGWGCKTTCGTVGRARSSASRSLRAASGSAVREGVPAPAAPSWAGSGLATCSIEELKLATCSIEELKLAT